MQKLNLLFLAVVCLSAVYPVTSVTRWFSTTFWDLKHTLYRFGHCVGEWGPLKDGSLNENDYLIHQIKEFLNQGNYDNEQLANVSSLMDTICRSDEQFPISVNIDVKLYNSSVSGKAAKEKRCQTIDDSLDAMYPIFKRASFNRSEPLDFSVIQFYQDPVNKSGSYNLTDLINTSWISSETVLENVCKITNSVKEYVQIRMNNSLAERREQRQPSSGALYTFFDLIDRVLDPILGLERRFYWEGNNFLLHTRSGISNQFGNIRGAFGSIVNRFRSATNSTLASNLTTASNSTLQKSTTIPSSVTFTETSNKNASSSNNRAQV